MIQSEDTANLMNTGRDCPTVCSMPQYGRLHVIGGCYHIMGRALEWCRRTQFLVVYMKTECSGLLNDFSDA
ncbi:MAG: hypothetical protein MRJ96_13640 [Nitrospirales bacterium]|nr:hypothetical protein [Nitrospira sp.]MDR4502487.1 hypothetical protein [Nitrospirales bacterium]